MAEIPPDAVLSEDGKYVIARGDRKFKKPVAVTSYANIVIKRPGEPKTGGKRVLSEKWDVYLECLRVGGRRMASARNAKIDYSTVKDRRKRDPEFAAAELEAEADAAEVIEDALFNMARKGNFTAAAMWLQNRDPDRWRDMRRADKQVVELTGNVTHTQELGSVTLERIASLQSALESRRAQLEAPVVIDVESTVVETVPES